jgi:Bacterial regulatory helix-turn-helix protein, lysR family
VAKHVAGPVIRATAMVREGRLHSSANGRRQPLQMHQVRYFLALCDELNFTRAARRCGISQPSLTQAIRALERELGGALFHREPSIALTRLARGASLPGQNRAQRGSRPRGCTHGNAATASTREIARRADEEA